MKQLIPFKVLQLKNKTKTYLLLVLVLAIWGTISYKFFSGLNPDISEIAEQDFNETFKPKTDTAQDTFSIKEVKRDPFLGTLASNKKNKTYSNKKVLKPKIATNNLKITYEGLIKKQNTADQVFVLNINNKQHLLKQGQIADSVKLITGNIKEVIVFYNNTSQTIKRQ